MHATIFLRTALFAYARGNSDAHVPSGVAAIEVDTVEEGAPKGGVLVKTRRFLDGSGAELEKKEVTLFIPWSKVDHLWVHEGS